MTEILSRSQFVELQLPKNGKNVNYITFQPLTGFLVFAIICMAGPILSLIYYIFEVKNLILFKNTIVSSGHFVEDAGTYSDQQCFDLYTNAVFEKVDFQYFVCLLISIIVGIIVILSILTDVFIIFLA